MKIGFIGLGNMGCPMAKRLVDAGYSMMVFDIDLTVLNQFQRLGVSVSTSAQEIGAICDVIITMLPNSQVVEKVILGEEGIIQTVEESTIIIDMSTANPLSTKKIGQTLADKKVDFLDAPVSGGVKGAVAGTLTIMVGGKSDAFSQVQPILLKLGKVVTHVGPLGSGHMIKVLNNLLSATHYMATAEVLSIGVKAGLDVKRMLDVINTSTGRNLSSEYKFPNFVLTRKFDSQFSMDLMCKDLSIALSVANDLSTPLFLSHVVKQFWSFANEQSGRSYDHTELVKFYEQWNGHQLVD